MIALLLGRQLIKDEELLETLLIIQLNGDREMKIIHSIDMASIGMDQACKRIQFDIRNDKNLIMLTEEDIKMYNFVTNHMGVMYDYKSDFEEQPEFFVFNDD